MNSVLTAIVGTAIDVFLKPTLQVARIRAALREAETVEYLRKGSLALCGLVTGVGIMAGGAILLPLALCLFMPWEPGTRLWVALAFAAAYVLIPLFIGGMLMSERRWQRRFHVDDMMREATAKQ